MFSPFDLSWRRLATLILSCLFVQAVMLLGVLAAHWQPGTAVVHAMQLMLFQQTVSPQINSAHAATVMTERYRLVPEQSPSRQQAQRDFTHYRIARGDTLTSIWEKHSGDVRGGIEAAKAFKQAGIPLNSLRAGEVLKLALSAGGKITEMHKSLPNGGTLVLKGSVTEGYQPTVIRPRIVEHERRISGEVSGCFASSAINAGVPAEVIDQFVDLFAGRILFRRDVQPGDKFSLIYTDRVTEAGTALSPGPIHAAAFENSGRSYAAVRYVASNGVDQYYDAKGEPLGNYFLRYPLQFTRISSVYSSSRLHPILKIRRPHRGVDFAAPRGTPVRAVADGVVTAAAYHGAGGKTVKINHGGRYTTAYLHLSRFAPGVRRGVHVKRGQYIGNVGSTGLSTGPHLDFRFYDRGRVVDPLKVKLPRIPKQVEADPEKYLQQALQALFADTDALRVASAGRLAYRTNT